VPIPWNADPPGSGKRLAANLRGIALEIKHDAPARLPATTTMAQDWHRRAFTGMALPVPYYAGEIRDTDAAFPELIGYEVEVGGVRGVPSADVPAALRTFESGMRSALAALDPVITIGVGPATVAELDAALRIAAIAHGEWTRIHPFANGNGRIARLWANWVAARYGLPLFVRLRPRPAVSLYAGAAALSMRGNHAPMVAVLHEMLRSYLSEN
jgi:fido (protein-threonine AMPylation protein)